MKVFKVQFDNNVAVTASFHGYSYTGGCEISREGTHPVINALVVIADNETESITIANEIVATYFKFIGPA